MQVLGRLFDHVLTKTSRRVTIVGATSGDTGSAAIEACRDREAIDIFVLHPHARVSEVPRRQMTTASAPNVFNIAIKGTFDDCQDLLKAMFADVAFRDRVALSRGQFDQLGAGDFAGGVLRLGGVAPGRAGPPGGVRRAHRQLRQRLRGLRGEGDGSCRSSS